MTGEVTDLKSSKNFKHLITSYKNKEVCQADQKRRVLGVKDQYQSTETKRNMIYSSNFKLLESGDQSNDRKL